MLEITVGDDSSQQQTYKIAPKGREWFLGDTRFDGDVVRISENRYHVIWNHVSYSIDVVESDIPGKSFKFLINGQTYATSARDELDLLLDGMGLNKANANKLNDVKAPMPGLIQSVMVREGDEVNKGDNLLVLVAMKMENVIRASGGGIVKSLKIVPGQIVEKSQVLLEFQ
jgi:biotin carboxyl carrier protein